MADIVLCIGTSPTPRLSLQPELWLTYTEGDYENPELAFPPHGWLMPYQDGVEYVSPEVQAKFLGAAPFAEQAA